MKRAARSVIQIDWLLFSLRWLFITGLGAYLFLIDKPANNTNALIVLGAAILFNILTAVLLVANSWYTIMPVIAVLVDSAVAVAAFWSLGWSPVILVWAAAFPAVTAGLRFRWVAGAVIMIAIIAIDSVLLLNLNLKAYQNLLNAIPSVALLFTITLLSGMVSDRVKLAAIKRTHAERDTEEKRVKHMREQARAIYDMADMVSATLNYERVLDAALDRATTVVSDTGSAASHMVSAALLFRDGQLRVSTARRFPPSDQKVALPARKGKLAEAISSGEAAYSAEPYRDPELSSFLSMRNCRSLMVVPLRVAMETYGVMLFAHPRADFFDLDHI